jgi:hypothetical protein
VEEPDLARAVPGAEQVQAQPPPIAARGGHEEPASGEAGLAIQAARQAGAEPSAQPSKGEPTRVGKHARGGGNTEEEPGAWL